MVDDITKHLMSVEGSVNAFIPSFRCGYTVYFKSIFVTTYMYMTYAYYRILINNECKICFSGSYYCITNCANVV